MGTVSIICQLCQQTTDLDQLLFCTALGEPHSRLQCRTCARTQTDAYLCHTCSDSVSASTADQQRYYCLRCLVCPVCGSGLNIRRDPDLYAYRCTFCCWTWASRFPSDLELSSACNKAIETSSQSEQRQLMNLVSKLGSEEGCESRSGEEESVGDHHPGRSSDGWLSSPILQSGIFGRWMSPLDPHRSINDMIPKRQLLLPRTTIRCAICDRFLIKPSNDMFSSAFDKNALASSFIPKTSFKNSSLYFENRTCHTLNLKIHGQEIILKPYEKIRNRRQVPPVAEGEEQVMPWLSHVALPAIISSEDIEEQIELKAENSYIESVSIKLSISSTEQR